jgi:hypothetical protein
MLALLGVKFPIVHSVEATWEQVADGTYPEAPWRQALREAVEEMAERARQAVPEANRQGGAACSRR